MNFRALMNYVLNALCFSLVELDESIIKTMMELVFELLCQGDLNLARLLRMKLIEKCEGKRKQDLINSMHNTPLSAISVTSK